MAINAALDPKSPPLAARRVVPVHFDSWGHFTEGRSHLVDAFTAAGLLDRLELGPAEVAAERG
jgi:hypothetical protein